MSTGKRLLFAALTTLLASCGAPTSPQTSESVQAEYVEGADGTVYSIDCLRTNAVEIQRRGKLAMSQCASNQVSVSAEGTAALSTNGKQAQKTFLIYPPYFYQPQTTNNNFCSYIFDYSYWDNNCINNYFGYSPSYSSYYSTGCNSCYVFNYSYICIQSCTQTGYYYPY